MNFEEYMDSKIPDWKTNVSIEEIENLKDLFNKVNDWEKVADNVFKLALSSNKSGIDYSNDYAKANANVTYYKNILENSIKKIRQNLGLEPPEKKETYIIM